MAPARAQRRLAAILAADVVGYSRLMAVDEAGTLAALRKLRSELVDPTIGAHHGRIVKLIGDGTLVEFASVVDAVECAISIQNSLRGISANQTDDGRIVFRIGINVGDVILDGEDLYGDGVNVAARLEAIAEPGGIAISEDAWRQVSGKVAARFIDRGEQSLKNIARPVRVYSVDLGMAPARQPAAHGTPAADIPSIAVLPFQNMSGDPEQDFFCDGLVEDIITTLSKLAGLRVIARNSSFVYKGRAVDVREAARQLGVRFVLEGSVRSSRNRDRIRIAAQLIDAKDGTHIWAERYDRAVDDIFAIQDEITLVLATEMQVKLTEGEQARLRYTTTSNVEAWTCSVKGLVHYRQAVTKEAWGSARTYWEKALALDSNSASLNALLGFMHCADARFEWWDDRATALDRARAYVDRALDLDPNNADAHTTASIIFPYEERFDDAVREARRAAELAPGSADAANFASSVLAPAGYPAEAVTLSERAIALSPHYPGNYLGNLGNAYHLTGRIEEAIAAFKGYDARSPGFGLVDLVIIYQQNGRSDEAKETATRLLAARPNFTIGAWARTQFRRDKARVEDDIAALRAVGLPPG
jgi:adenylate cyclase